MQRLSSSRRRKIQGSDWGRWPFLAKVPEEIAKQRQDYMTNRHKGQDEAVANDLMKEQDSRMPINVERQSRVTFGGTKK